MSAVFISYRRADSEATTHQLATALAKCFGDDMVFRDQEAIDAGADFSKVILDAVRAASAVLIIIGPCWLKARSDDGKPRLERTDDLVRLEFETAVAWHAPIVPVLVGGADMPKAESLPQSMRPLAAANACTLGEATFDRDVAELARQLQKVYGVEPVPAGAVSYIGGRLEAVRRYPANLARLVRRPKRYLASRALGRHRDGVDAQLFLFCSTLIAVWLAIAEWPGHTWELFVAGVSVGLLATLVLSIPVCVAWRVVGARDGFGRALTIFAYQLSVIHLGFGLSAFIGFSSVNFGEPELLRHVQETVKSTGLGPELSEAINVLSESSGMQIIAPLFLAMSIALPIWFGISWGAYRRAAGLSRWHSAAAFSIAVFIVLIPIALVTVSAADERVCKAGADCSPRLTAHEEVVRDTEVLAARAKMHHPSTSAKVGANSG